MSFKAHPWKTRTQQNRFKKKNEKDPFYVVFLLSVVKIGGGGPDSWAGEMTPKQSAESLELLLGLCLGELVIP